MFARRLDAALMESTLARARVSPRRRANHCFHAPADRLQRMVIAALAGSYFPPHRHKDPDKLEIFTILSGRVLAITFDDAGGLDETALLSADPEERARGAVAQVEIPPGAWHTLAVLSPEAVIYEVIDGYFDAKTHKRFAPWAPSEADAEGAQAYLTDLIERCGAV
ncbi:MAG: WbuC family cupin fold metalloprotein [Fibrobacteres bacterium]|nr:WbuC family cupin fold metalloprotein [Fibrobacterota bacterium]